MGNGTAVVMLLRKVIKINWAGQAAVARDRALRVRRPDGDEGGDDGGEDEGVALLAGDDDEPSERHDGADDAGRLAADSEADRARTECERPSFCLQIKRSADFQLDLSGCLSHRRGEDCREGAAGGAAGERARAGKAPRGRDAAVMNALPPIASSRTNP